MCFSSQPKAPTNPATYEVEDAGDQVEVTQKEHEDAPEAEDVTQDPTSTVSINDNSITL